MKGLLSKMEYLLIALFAVLFLVWAVSKCNASKTELQAEAAETAKEDSLAAAKTPPVAKPLPAQPQTAQPEAGTAQTSPSTTGTAAATTPAAEKPAAKPAPSNEPQYSKLFVTIDKLKLRKKPGLKSELLGELKLFDEVYYMNEVTDSSYQVNLGKETANEPYVKIKTKKGTVGWVYGAGVHYAKKKRSGVLEK